MAAGAFAPQLDLPLSELPDALVRDDARQRYPGLVVELDLDADVVPLDQVLPLQRRLRRGCRSVIRTQASARGTTMTSPAATG